MRFDNKTAVITGGASGFGKAFALAFAGEGSNVVLADVDRTAMERTAAELEKMRPGCAAWRTCDVVDASQVDQTMQYALDKFGTLDILVNNAGGGLGVPKATVDQVEEAHWDRVVDINLKGTFLCTRSACRHMKNAGYGKMVNLASIAARMGGKISSVHYVAAKGAIMALTRQVALEMGSYGINVNAIAPSLVLTGERVQNLWHTHKTEEQRQAFLDSVPLGRLASMEDVAQVVLFLCSDQAGYLTGLTVDVNGGLFSV